MADDWTLLAPAWLGLLPLAWWLAARLGPAEVEPLAWQRVVSVRHPLAVTGRAPVMAPLAWVPRLMMALALSCLVLALAQPVQRQGAQVPTRAPFDLILVVDTSVSMTLKDYVLDGEPIDRLSVALALLDVYLQTFSGHRVAILVVGSPSALWLPLSADLALVRHQLARLKLAMAGRLGAIGDALALVADTFPAAHGSSVLLVTDGVAPSGRLSPQQGARAIAAAGMRLHTMALGARAGQAVDADIAGLIYQPPDLDLLATLADLGGGRMLHAEDLVHTQAQLALLRGADVGVADPLEPGQMQPRYPFFLAAGILLLLMFAGVYHRAAGAIGVSDVD